MYRFDQIHNVKRFMFVPRSFEDCKNMIVIPSKNLFDIGNDTFWWRKYIDVYELINTKSFSC